MSVQRFRAGEYVEVPIRDPQGKWVRWSDYEELQFRLAQVEQELAEEKRLRAELKHIAQIGISEVSSVGTVLKDNAVIDFRSRAVQLCKDKAVEWRQRSDSEPGFTRASLIAKGFAADEIATELEKL